jgi:hypothetical protein
MSTASNPLPYGDVTSPTNREIIAAIILAGLYLKAEPNTTPDSHIDQALKTADNLIREAAIRPQGQETTTGPIGAKGEDGTEIGGAGEGP